MPVLSHKFSQWRHFPRRNFSSARWKQPFSAHIKRFKRQMFYRRNKKKTPRCYLPSLRVTKISTFQTTNFVFERLKRKLSSIFCSSEFRLRYFDAMRNFCSARSFSFLSTSLIVHFTAPTDRYYQLLKIDSLPRPYHINQIIVRQKNMTGCWLKEPLFAWCLGLVHTTYADATTQVPHLALPPCYNDITLWTHLNSPSSLCRFNMYGVKELYRVTCCKPALKPWLGSKAWRIKIYSGKLPPPFK